jgi:hypothetical protein
MLNFHIRKAILKNSDTASALLLSNPIEHSKQKQSDGNLML